jgi:phosphoribosyl 1,2-cyclic phosphodiesterase
MSDPGCTLPIMSSGCALRVVFLGSGSGGNATVVSDGATTLLIDCGFSAREVVRRLALAGIAASDVRAVLITHEHSDHIRGVEVFQRRHGMAPVASTAATRRVAGFAALTGEWLALTPGEPTRFGTLSVLPFRTSHDAAEPVGFRIESDTGASFGLATDTGCITEETAEALLGVEMLGIESNHDLTMLENGPYPYYLKRRIRSERGHLSNVDACDALSRLASEKLTHVFALHRSNTNNSASIVQRELGARAAALGLPAKVKVAMQADVLDSHPPQGTLFAG